MFRNIYYKIYKSKSIAQTQPIFLSLITSHEGIMPMIPLGLKETKEINFMEPFSDFILEHYSEEPSIYMDAIADMTDTRQVSSIESDTYRYLSIFY